MRVRFLACPSRRHRAWRRMAILLVAALALGGCEYFISDVATRVRYALDREAKALQSSADAERTFSIRPDHWPDACGGDAGYRLTLSPDRGDKAVASGDIRIDCVHGGPYYTGMGSEAIYVSAELRIDKRADEDLIISLRRSERGTEIVRLQ